MSAHPAPESAGVGPTPCALRRDQALLEASESRPHDLVEGGLTGSSIAVPLPPPHPQLGERAVRDYELDL